MLEISEIPILPVSTSASVMNPEMPACVMTVFYPKNGMIKTMVQNISLDGARELIEHGTLVSLRETNEGKFLPIGEKP